jgi:glucose/arabinose dehydrogenase
MLATLPRPLRWGIVAAALSLLCLALLAVFVFLRLRAGGGIGSPSVLPDAPAPTTVALDEFDTVDGLSLPPGFSIAPFAQGLNGPRMLAIGPDGSLYVTERGAGRVLALPDADRDGIADRLVIAAEDLTAPSGLAFYQDGSLYVAEPGGVKRFLERTPEGKYTNPETIISGIPTSGHNTRTLLFSPDWQTLYVSIGSSCNVCEEEDVRRAAIVRYNPDGSGEALVARGLRNAVGLTLRPGTSEIWVTNNGRDWLGDDLPPETIYVVQDGADYGWPRCHAGRISDPDFGGPEACDGVVDPQAEMQAHSAPLGLTFYSGDLFPEAYRGDLFVAFHGSWNRTQPTGYKIVRIPMENGQPGPVEDFAWGWLAEGGGQRGRPVDVITGPDGALYVSDDQAGIIYRITFPGQS